MFFVHQKAYLYITNSDRYAAQELTLISGLRLGFCRSEATTHFRELKVTIILDDYSCMVTQIVRDALIHTELTHCNGKSYW